MKLFLFPAPGTQLTFIHILFIPHGCAVLCIHIYCADIRERKIPLLLMANKMDLRDALSSVAVRLNAPRALSYSLSGG